MSNVENVAPAIGRSRSAWPALLLLSTVLAVGAGAQLVFSPLQELIKGELSLSDFQISLLQGLAAALPIALFSIPIGRMVDRSNRVRLLIAMGLVWTIGTLMTAFAHSFELLFVARALASVGVVCGLTAALSLAADLSTPDQRGRAQVVLSVGRMFGSALAFALGGALVGMLTAHPAAWADGMAPWRGVHVIFAVVSLLLILPLFFFREPARHESSHVVNPSFGEAMHAIWQRRVLLAPLFLGQVTVVMADASAGIWAAPVLVRDYGLQPEQFGAWMGMVIFGSGLIGSILGGVLADFGHKGRIRGGILIGAVIASIASIPAAFFPVMPTVTGFALMLTVMLMGGAIAGLVTATALTVLVPNELRGVCLGAFMVVGAVFGLGVAPTLVTLVSSLLGGEAHVAQALTIIGVASSAIAAVGFLSAMKASRQLA